MKVETTRFGQIEVDENRLIEFPEGILGFADSRKFALVQTNDEGNFFWLQSLDRPELAFVVCDPLLFVPDYQVPVKSEDLGKISIKSKNDVQVFVIVNKINRTLTGNLQGPLVINVHNRKGRQLVLSEKKYSTRHPLVELAPLSQEVSKIA